MPFLFVFAFHIAVAHAQPPSSPSSKITSRVKAVTKKLDLRLHLEALTAAKICNCQVGHANSVLAREDMLSQVSHQLHVQMDTSNDNKTLSSLRTIYLSLFKADAPMVSSDKYQVGFKIHGHHSIRLQATARF